MKKFYDTDQEEVWTEDELREEHKRWLISDEWSAEEKRIYADFNYWINCCLVKNNGNLEEIGDDWMINRLQRDVAMDLACDEMPYEKCLEVLQKYNWFGTWTAWEINHRPVDIDAVREMVEQELGLR